VTDSKIDRKTPTITLTTPADGAAYRFSVALLWPVVVSYACSDAGAGVASCGATQANGAPLATGPGALGAQTFTVTATDRAANTSTVTHRYTITLWPTCEGRAATIVANAAQRVISGTPGRDVIVGSDAAESIDGHGGDDTICSGGDDDRVRGGTGNDTIRSGDGNDRLLGDSGDDLLLGGPGTDDLRGGGGNDRLGGGDGNDRVDGGAGADLLDEMRLSGRGNDRLFGAPGNDHIRTAGATKDTVDCGPGRDFALLDTRDKQQRCDSIRRVTPELR
jgi:Ca2+-binding RTX toxin-like protein